MFKNTRLVILFDMFLNPSFKMTTRFSNIARTAASIFIIIPAIQHKTCVLAMAADLMN